ncbi:MAG: ABC transporter permease [Firmicutes bacterium]|nr:ABC transporter permease [Bacillota bacterium]
MAEMNVTAAGTRNRYLTHYVPPVLSLLLGLVVWEIVGRLRFSDIVAPLTDTMVAWWKLIGTGELLANLKISLLNFAIGFLLAVVTGIVLGALMGRFRTVQQLCELWINLGNSAPMLAFIPLLIILFGLGDTTRIFVVYTFAFWVIVVNTFVGTRYINPDLMEMAGSFGASERQMFWKIMLPGALPMIMAGLQLGVGRAVKGMINGEMLITIVGLGAMIRIYGGGFNGSHLFAVVITIVAVAIILSVLIQILHRRLAHWDR